MVCHQLRQKLFCSISNYLFDKGGFKLHNGIQIPRTFVLNVLPSRTYSTKACPIWKHWTICQEPWDGIRRPLPVFIHPAIRRQCQGSTSFYVPVHVVLRDVGKANAQPVYNIAALILLLARIMPQERWGNTNLKGITSVSTNLNRNSSPYTTGNVILLCMLSMETAEPLPMSAYIKMFHPGKQPSQIDNILKNVCS